MNDCEGLHPELEENVRVVMECVSYRAPVCWDFVCASTCNVGFVEGVEGWMEWGVGMGCGGGEREGSVGGRNDGLMWLVCKECGGGMAEGCGCVFLLNELIRNM